MSDIDAIRELVIRELLEASDSPLEAEQITDDSSLRDDLGLDSLQSVNVVMALEEAFEVEVDDEEIESLETVGDIFSLIREKTGAD